MSPQKKMVAAYLSDWAWQGIREGDEKKLTHINYSFARVENGRVSDAHWSNEAAIDEAIRRHSNITFVISVGGWGAGGFSEAVSTEEGRKLFAESAVEVMNKHGFKGIDLDWEYPCRSDAGIASSPDDKHNFTLMMELLRGMLDEQSSRTGEKYLLTMAVGAGEIFTKDLELDKLNDIVDYVNLMTYDMASRELVTHHTNLYPSNLYACRNSVDQTVKAYHDAGISMDKLIIGSGFYGHCYETETDGEVIGRKDMIKVHNMGFTAIDQLEGYTYHFDESAKAPYLYNGKKVIVYDDPVSLKHKVQYVYEKDLGGIMFWEYNSDRTGKLLDAIDSAVKDIALV